VLKAKGTLSVEPEKNRIVLNLSSDFVRYYNWFIERHFWVSLGTPMHGAHITLSNSKFHSGVNWKKAIYHHGKEIEFEYDVNMIRGGYTKGFVMFYMLVFSEELEKLKKKFRIKDGEKYRGLHITVANGKGTNMRPYWPKMIEIKSN
jgi:hypothetical protein